MFLISQTEGKEKYRPVYDASSHKTITELSTLPHYAGVSRIFTHTSTLPHPKKNLSHFIQISSFHFYYTTYYKNRPVSYNNNKKFLF